jgi:ribosome-associated heat shock protein Hsp15
MGARKGRPGAAEDGDGTDESGARIDRWLWMARLYKSRSLAAVAVAGGRVRLNGARVKPARALAPGDRLTLSIGGRDVDLDVRGLPQRRGPAAEARLAYEETPESVARGVQFNAQHRLAAMTVPRPEGRPDKKARRDLMELARRQGRD